MTGRVLLALAVLPLAGCYTIRYERHAAPEAGAPRETWHNGLVSGVFDLSGPVQLREMCPGGVASVEHQVTFANGLLQTLTSIPGTFTVLNVWTPATVRVRCAAGGTAAAGRAVKVVLVPLAALAGVEGRTTKVFDEALAGELRRHPRVSVITQSDVVALLGVEKERAMLGCSDAGCMAQIGGALGADRVVHGSVGRVGSSLVVNLSSLEARKATQAASVSERLRGAGDEAFLDALPGMVARLLAEPAPAR
jgi:hypothetical protein